MHDKGCAVRVHKGVGETGGGEFSFRDTEFIFPEEIRKGILRDAFREMRLFPPRFRRSSRATISGSDIS